MMVMHIVRKDFTYLFTSLKWTVFLIILFTVCLSGSNVGMGCVMPALICYMGFYNLMAYEERNKMNLLNIALPVERKDICLAKYIQVIIFIVIGSLLSAASVFLAVKTGDTKMAFWEGKIGGFLLTGTSIGLIYSGFIMPWIFYFGTLKSRYVLIVSYIIFFSLGNIINLEFLIEATEFLQRMNQDILGFVGLLVAILVFVISYSISLRIWEKREF
ncbi:MAG: ABC-2 transporter permease [Cellulosilyticum sp.]|nr:ABC-2 transporter permease [Cellulosilyticum sp.]